MFLLYKNVFVFFVDFLVSSLVFWACGLPDSPELPTAPISVDNDSSDNRLAFQAPSDSKIDRYIIWYKIYPYLTRTGTENLINQDYDEFRDLSVQSPSDIRKRDYYPLQLSPNLNDGSLFREISAGQVVAIRRQPGDTSNYIVVTVAGGRSYNVRRNVAVSLIDNSRKPFYGKFDRTNDADLKTRRNSDFRNYGPLNKGFAVAFVAQSAYVDSGTLTIQHSTATPLGSIYADEGFENN